MTAFTRRVAELQAPQRKWLEENLGQPLEEHARIVVHVLPGGKEVEAKIDLRSTLPEYFNVFEGMSDDEIADVERAILARCDRSRPTPID